MASTATTAFQIAAMAAATHYLFQPQPYYTAGNIAAERTEQAFKQFSEHGATKTAAYAIQVVLRRVPGRMGQAVGDPHKVEKERAETEADADAAAGAVERSSSDVERLPDEAEDRKDHSTTPSDTDSATSPASPTSSTTSLSDTHFHEPSNLFGAQCRYQLPSLSKSELDQILEAVQKRRRHRHEETQHRVQRYRTGGPFIPTESPKKKAKKAKKTVRFALDTKPSSTSIPSNPADTLLSPTPPSPSGELAYFSASLAAVPGSGSLFTHPNDFNESELIRRLPSQMKNGAGGIAWCRGRTEQGLYLLDTPVKRVLLDLRAGVGYDGRDGRMMGSEEVIGCVLWGRGKKEERWGGFRWRGGLAGVGK